MGISIQQFISYFSTVPLLAVCVLGVVRYRRLDTTRRYLVWLSLLALLVSGVALWLVFQKRPNLFLAPIDAAIEFTLLALMYRRTLHPAPVARYVPVLIGGFLLGTALSYQPRLDTAEFSPVQHTIESLLVLAFVLLYFRRQLRPPMSPTPLEHEPMFWVSVGLLLYFSGNLFIFISSNTVLKLSETMSEHVWAIHALLYCFLNGFYAVALCVDPRPRPGVTQS